MTESTLVTVGIVANEKRKSRCFDIPSAFVNTDVDEDVLMVLKGELVDMMIQIDPGIQEVRYHQQERNVRSQSEAEESALWADEGKPALLLEITKEIGGLWIHSQSI